MISGYKALNENILKTIDLIKGVESSSKEQLAGIEQINHAITSLDQQTQQNAQIASQTYEVAVQTDSIAKLVVSNANDKNFIGKDSVKAKDLSNTTSIPKASKPLDSAKLNAVCTTPPFVQKTQTKQITSNLKDDDEWTSF